MRTRLCALNPTPGYARQGHFVSLARFLGREYGLRRPTVCCLVQWASSPSPPSSWNTFRDELNRAKSGPRAVDELAQVVARVAARVLDEIVLVVVFGFPEVAGFDDLGDDGVRPLA